MIINKEGIIQKGTTEITKTFFQKDLEEKFFGNILNYDREKNDLLKKWFKNVWKGRIKFKDLKSLGPKNFINKEKNFIELDYKAIYKEGNKKDIDKIICIAKDKTKEIALEKKLNEDMQNAIFVRNCLQNPNELIELIIDSNELIEVYPTIVEMDNNELFRKFHTLKARFGSFWGKRLMFFY